MSIFDDIARTDLRRGSHSESAFDFLNRSARADVANVRGLLEGWLGNYPAEHRHELVQRFRVSDRRGYEAPFFELFVHEMLLRCGLRSTVHPSIVGTARCPDFLVESDSGSSFYVECAVVRDESKDEAGCRNQEDRIYDALNEIDSPNFFLKIQIHERSAQAPSARRLRHFLQTQLRNLDPDGPIPSGWEYVSEGWRLWFEPIAKGWQSRGTPGLRPLGILSMRTRWGGTCAAIRNKISEKATRYGELGCPYVIAINVTSEWGCDDDDILDGLFGTLSETYRPTEAGIEHVDTRRSPDGAWRGREGPVNTRNSAVILARAAAPWNVASVDLCLYVNPHAQRPLVEILDGIPKAIVDATHLRLVDGMTSAELFGLPERWPSA